MTNDPILPKSPRRVLLFGSFGPSLEVFRGALISAIVAGGDELHAMAPQIDRITQERITARGAIVHPVSFSRTSLGPLAFVSLLQQIARKFRSIKPDVVIAYTIKPVVIGSLVNRKARFVAVVTGLGYAFTQGPGIKRKVAKLAARSLYRMALSRADIVLMQNRDDLEELRRLGALPSTAPVGLLNGSGVELDRFTASPPPSEPRFLMASRLLGDKGVREFAYASAQLLRARPDVRIDLAGFFDGSPDSIHPDELEDMVAHGVRYLGHLDDVRPAMRACSVYVLPSYREGTPRSVLEAMAMGRAIITTDAPGCRETVLHGRNGLLVQPRDGAALASAMAELAADPERVRKMGVESRKLAEERFDVRIVNDCLLRHARLR